MNRYLILTLVVLTSSVAMQSTAGPTRHSPVPLPHAHAHNDYYHKRPLLDALDQGFCSVEADVFLVNGRLLVGHSRTELNSTRSLRSLYLEPLKQRVAANQGRVFRQGPPFTLLIDIKSDADATYSALRKVLTEYDDMLSTTSAGKHQQKAVTVVISGNRAQEAIVRTTDRHAGIDGRLTDIDSKVPSHLMPLISDNWGRHFSWRGQGKMPEKERQKLRDTVKKIHQSGRRVRFWATPEDSRVWSELLDAGVDLIGTDDLSELSRFLKARKK
jgi:glycerophosphoryl diester phosphodiesterase